MTVCRTHGGGAPRAKRRDCVRVSGGSRRPCMTSSRQGPPQRLGAIKEVLERRSYVLTSNRKRAAGSIRPSRCRPGTCPALASMADDELASKTSCSNYAHWRRRTKPSGTVARLLECCIVSLAIPTASLLHPASETEPCGGPEYDPFFSSLSAKRAFGRRMREYYVDDRPLTGGGSGANTCSRGPKTCGDLSLRALATEGLQVLPGVSICSIGSSAR
jgi:hypothetical protein